MPEERDGRGLKRKACEMKVGLDNIQKISIYGAQELCIQRKWAMNIGEG